MGKKTKLLYTNEMHDQEVSVSGPWDADIYAMGTIIYGVLLAAGYAESSIAEILDIEETYELREDK